MTCIAGISRNGKVTIGGDSAGVDSNYNLMLRADPKVFRNSEFIIGYTTSFRMGQLLRFNFVPPKQKEQQDEFAYMCTDFVDAVRKCFADGGFKTVDKNVESAGTFLIAYRNHLFKMESDFQISQSMKGIDACGCGESYALGAMNVLVAQDI